MTQFKIQTKDNGIFVGEFATNSPSEVNNKTRGQSATFELEFEEGELVVESGDTYTIDASEFEGWDHVIVRGTLTVNGELNCNELTIDNGTVNDNGTITIGEGYVNNYSDLLDYDRFSGSYTPLETLGNKYPYSERIDGSIDSLVFGIEPSDTLQSEYISGIWGILDNITDSRNQPLSINRITIDVTILAQFDEYADHAALEADLKL